MGRLIVNPDQFKELIIVLRQLVDKPYTLTGAADWPLLMALAGIIISLIVFNWHSIAKKIDDHQDREDKEHKDIWRAIDDCCPRYPNKENEKR